MIKLVVSLLLVVVVATGCSTIDIEAASVTRLDHDPSQEWTVIGTITANVMDMSSTSYMSGSGMVCNGTFQRQTDGSGTGVVQCDISGEITTFDVVIPSDKYGTVSGYMQQNFITAAGEPATYISGWGRYADPEKLKALF